MANEIYKIKVGTSDYPVRDNRVLTLTDASTTAGTWVATAPNLSAYADGQLFLYTLAVAGGSSSTTLNINSIGAKPVYRQGITPLTTQFAVGCTLLLVYNATNTCFRVVNFYDTNDNTHRPIQVNGTEILGNNTTPLNLKAGSNVTLSNSGGTVTISSSYSDTNQKVKAGSVTFGNNDEVNFVGSGPITVTGDATNKVITISAPAYPTVNNGQLTMQVNGTQKATFTANQSGNSTFNVTAADLGLSSAIKFVGISSTDPTSTSGATVSGHTTWAKGEMVLYKRSGETYYEEYLNITGSNTSTDTPNPNWELLGDADSYARKGVETGASAPGTDSQGKHTHSVTVAAADRTAASAGTHSHTFSGGSAGAAGAHTHAVTGSVASAGNHSHSVTAAGKISVGTGVVNYTPAGTVSQPTFSGSAVTSESALGNHSHTYTPAGTVSNHSHSIGKSSATIYQITDVGSVPSLSITATTVVTEVSGSYLSSVKTNGSASLGGTTTFNTDAMKARYNGEVIYFEGASTASVTLSHTDPTFNSGSVSVTKTGVGSASNWSAGAVPTRASLTVITGVDANTGNTQPTFTGTASNTGNTDLSHTHSVTAAGTVSKPTFTGTGVELVFTGSAVNSTQNGTHTHSISTDAVAASAGEHTHTVTGTVDSAGAHTHTVSVPAVTVTTTEAGSHSHTVNSHTHTQK